VETVVCFGDGRSLPWQPRPVISLSLTLRPALDQPVGREVFENAPHLFHCRSPSFEPASVLESPNGLM